MSPRAGLTEAAVVATAAELADRDGIEAVSLAAVAGRLGVRPPSLYNHVDGLAGLRRGLAVLAAEELANRLLRAAAGKSGEDAVLAIAHAYRAFVDERPGLYAATLRAPGPGEDRLTAAAFLILEVVAAALEPYGLNEDGRIDAIRGLRSLIHGFVTLEQGGGFGMPRDVDRSFEWALRAYLAGLAQAAQAPADTPTPTPG